MKRIIAVSLLVSVLFSGVAYSASVPWTCTSCGKTFYFAPGDDAHRSSWTANHYSYCSGGGGTGYVYQGRGSFAGYLLLGGLTGGMLGGLYGLAYAQPEMWAYAGLGAFLGGVALGLLWTVSAE
jgi:hypothetical protein